MNYNLTPDQQAFVREHRLEMSIKQMAAHFEIPLNRVRNYMIENRLMLTNEQVQRIKKLNRPKVEAKPEKEDSFQEPEHVSDPWNHGINLLIMRTL